MQELVLVGFTPTGLGGAEGPPTGLGGGEGPQPSAGSGQTPPLMPCWSLPGVLGKGKVWSLTGENLN